MSTLKQTNVSGWEQILKEAGHSDIKVDYSNNRIHLKCVRPNHNDSSASACLSVKYGNYYCWSCPDKHYTYDPIELLQQITGESSTSKCEDLFEEVFDFRVSNTEKAEISSYKQDSQILKFFVDFCNYMLVTAWQQYTAKNITQEFSVYEKAVKWLISKKITQASLSSYLNTIGVIPSQLSIKNNLQAFLLTHQLTANPSEVEKQFIEYFGESITTKGHIGALLFPHFTSPTDVGRFQARVDFLSNSTTHKFCFVTPSIDESKTSEAVQRMAKRKVGFFGLSYASKLITSDKVLYATEGATDCIALLNCQFDSLGHVGVPVVGISGVGIDSNTLNSLSTLGINSLKVCQDNPRDKGDAVLETYINMSTDIDVMGFVWKKEDSQKDMFKLYESSSSELFNRLVASDSFMSSEQYLVNKTTKLCKEENNNPIACRKIVEDICSKLSSPSLRKAYLNSVSRNLPDIHVDDLRKSAELISGEDSIEGFMARLELAVKDKYDFVYRRFDRASSSILIAYRSKSNDKIVIEEKITSAWSNNIAGVFLTNDVGSVLDWIDKLKPPASVTTVGTGKKVQPKSPRSLKAEVLGCLEIVMSSIAANTPFFYDAFGHLGNGVHCIISEDVEKMLVVNGDFRFLGEFKEDGTMSWEEYLPELSGVVPKSSWSNHISSVEDLLEGNSVNPREIWEGFYNAINIGWKFKEQSADCTWLTALVLYSAFYDFLPNTLLTSVSAEAQSGKSKLVKGVFGGKVDIHDTVMPNSPFFVYMDFPQTSEAGIRQTFSGSEGTMRRGLVLDEFEWNPRSPRSQQTMSAILDTCRSMLDGAAYIQKGTKSGKSRDYNVRFPLVTAGISEYRDDTGATESRIFRIEMKHSKHKSSPKEDIIRAFPDFDGKRLTRLLSIGMFRHAMTCRRYTEEIYRKYEREDYIRKIMKHYPNDRSASLVCIIGGVLKVCGFTDSEIEIKLAKVFDKMCKTLEARTESAGQQLYERILSEKWALPADISGGSLFTNVKEYVTLKEALANPDFISRIGGRDFFPFVCVLQDSSEDKTYLLFDRHYLKDFLDKEGITWIQFKTTLDRSYNGIEEDKEIRTTARRISGNSKYSKSEKKMCMITVELSDFTEDDEDEQPMANGSTEALSEGLSKLPYESGENNVMGGGYKA